MGRKGERAARRGGCDGRDETGLPFDGCSVGMEGFNSCLEEDREATRVSLPEAGRVLALDETMHEELPEDASPDAKAAADVSRRVKVERRLRVLLMVWQ